MSLNAGEISGSLKFDISDYTRAIAQAQSTSSIFPGIVSNSLDSPLQGFLGTIQKVKESLQGGLKLDVSEYTHAILQAQSISSIFPGIVTNFLVNPLLGFIDTIKEAGSALVGLAFRFSELQNHTRQLAESLGVSLQFLDGWGKAATLAGGKTDDVAGMMTHLSHAATMAATRGGRNRGRVQTPGCQRSGWRGPPQGRPDTFRGGVGRPSTHGRRGGAHGNRDAGARPWRGKFAGVSESGIHGYL